MELLQFGNTKLEVTKIGLGMAALGRPGYINLGHGKDLAYNYEVEAMQANAFQVLDTAYKNGIRYFDVARSYGRGEEFLGNWLKERRDGNEIVVGSKWGYTYTAAWEVKAEKHEVKEHTIDVLNRQWPLSKELLGQYLGIYHIHSATLESGVLERKAVLDKLWDLKNSGYVVGLSLSGEHQYKTLKKALKIRDGNELLFQSVQATWNVLEQSATEILKEASAQGMGIIIKEALANGRLTSRNNDPGFAEQKVELQLMAQKYRIGIDALAIAFALRQPWVNVVLSGASNAAQLISNIQALKISLREEDIDNLQSMAELPAFYWKKRSSLAWN